MIGGEIPYPGRLSRVGYPRGSIAGGVVGLTGLGHIPWYFRCQPGGYLRQGNPGALRAPIAPFWSGPDDFHANLGVFHAGVLYPGRFLAILTILKVLQVRVKRK